MCVKTNAFLHNSALERQNLWSTQTAGKLYYSTSQFYWHHHHQISQLACSQSQHTKCTVQYTIYYRCTSTWSRPSKQSFSA